MRRFVDAVQLAVIQAREAALAVKPDPPTSGGGKGSAAGSSGAMGVDWNVKPTLPKALGKLDMWSTVAGVLMWLGYVVGFLVLIGCIIMWSSGGKIFGRHVGEEAKATAVRVCAGGLLLGSAGAIWSFVIAG